LQTLCLGLIKLKELNQKTISFCVPFPRAEIFNLLPHPFAPEDYERAAEWKGNKLTFNLVAFPLHFWDLGGGESVV